MAAEQLQLTDLAAELAIETVAPHGFVEVADYQWADVAAYGTRIVGGTSIETD